MSPIRIFVSTRDGQSDRIAQNIVRQVSDQGLEVLLYTLAKETSQYHDHILDSSFVVGVAAVRYGRHLPEAETFLSLFKKSGSPPPLALISVNQTARKEGRQSARDNPYLHKVIDRH